MKRFLNVFLKGMWIGGTLTVPGVSGGSMAMVLGVYEPLIRAVNGLVGKEGDKRAHLRFLSLFSLGAMLGIFALSGVVSWLLGLYPVSVLFFFVGAVAGGIPLIIKQMDHNSFRWHHILFMLGGMILVLLLSLLPVGIFEISAERGVVGIFWQLVGGFIAAVALVLPGISVSHMLYVLGIYEGVIGAVVHLKLWLLVPFAIGVVCGILLMTKAVEYLLLHFKTATYMTILGFVLGSIAELISDVQFNDINIICYLLFAAGFFAIYTIFKKKKADA